MATDASERPRVIAFPLSGIDYCDQLYRAAAALGVVVVEGLWAGRWILRNVRRGDLAHLHWPSFLYFRQGAPLGTLINLARFVVLLGLIRLRGARIAWTAHNLYPHVGGRSKWVHRAARRVITRVADTIFVHGPTAAALVGAEFGIEPGRLVQVPHGHWRGLYPRMPSRREARIRMRQPHNVALFGFIGSCLPYKNVEAVLAALPRIDDASQLLIAGAFPTPGYLEKIRTLIAPAMASRVRIVPEFLTAEEMMTYLAGIDALVLSYKEILTSGVVMLALSAGIPVVAPRMGGLPDVVNDACGVLYEPGDPDGLVKAMREVLRRSYSPEKIIAHALSFDWTDSARHLKEALVPRAS
jgi:glycosyltransferase involved in cell wall biosynthesis